MRCPDCSSNKIKVLDKRDDYLKNAVRRRRTCCVCNYRWTTFERIVDDESDALQTLKRIQSISGVAIKRLGGKVGG